MEKKVPVLEYLNGPVSWYEFLFKDDNGNEKMIHLFGDIHITGGKCDEKLKCMRQSSDEPSDCYDFLYFLENLFDEVKKNNLYADLFVEIPYLIKSNEDLYEKVKVNNVISGIYNKFQSCIKRNKKKCSYLPNVRMHFTDVRTILLSNEDIDPLMAILKGRMQQNVYPINSFLNLSKYMILDLFEGILYVLLEINSIQVTINNQEKLVTPNIQGIQTALYHIEGEQLFSRINMIKIFFMILDNFCKFIEIIISSDDYIEDMNRFLEPYSKILTLQSDIFIDRDIEELSIVLDRLREFKHPKSSYSIVGHQLAELEKDQIIVNGKNIATLIKNYILSTCKEYLSQKNGSKIIDEFNKFIGSVLMETDEGIIINPKLNKAYQKITSQQDIKNFYVVLENETKKLFVLYNNFAQIYNETITVLESRLLDAFILSRLFRTYSSSKEPHVPSILSIIYSGDLHTKFQVEFFKNYLGLKPIHEVENDENKIDFQCLHSKELKTIFNL
jgi:hypothetical protein